MSETNEGNEETRSVWRQEMSIGTAFQTFPDVNPTIILKLELLRQGVRISKGALKSLRDVDTSFKGYFLFSYDRSGMVSHEDKIPECMYIKDDTAVQIRTYDRSPYVIDEMDGKSVVCENGDPIEEIHFIPAPKFYSKNLGDGTPIRTIVDAGLDRLFVTINKYCEMFKTGDQCLFCDFVPTTIDQKKKGAKIIVHKDPEQVAEALAVALEEPRFRHIYLTGGTIMSSVGGMNQIEYYCQHLNAIRKRLKVWYPTNFQIGALVEDDLKRIYDTGVGVVQPNIEVWDRNLFKILCPGKEKYVGYDEWIKRTIKAVDIFGPWRVMPNFVTGVEMAKPMGFKDVDSAVKSTLGGFEFLMQHEVMPRMDTWCIEQNSKLGGQEPPPLEYYVRIGQGYTSLRKKYGVSLPIAESRENYHIDCQYDWEYSRKR
jgi:hypothetical protein